MNSRIGADLECPKKSPCFKLLKFATSAALGVSVMSVWAGTGRVCLDGVTPLTATNTTCAAGTIGTYYAHSPLLRKFVDTLPGLTGGNANSFGAGQAGEYIPIAVADTVTYPGSEYFIIGVVEHQQWMHSDLQKATTLRSYVQLYPRLSERPAGATNPPAKATDTLTGQVLPSPVALTYPNGSPIYWPGTTEQVYAYDKPHYLGPIILTTTGTPVRTQMVNLLPTGRATPDAMGSVRARNGDMFLPVDESLGGAGVTPTGDKYPQNRAAFHLHGGDSPWISDGTPHQWIAPGADSTPYKAGNRLLNVPDMPFPGSGSQTIFWPNDQSSRLMWYHDHTFGLTRQNAYGGLAAGYVIMDAAELALLNGGTVTTPNGSVTINKAIPNTLLDQIVLVIQDKTFVPSDIAVQDAKWDTNAWGKPGDLWYPHVYEPFQLWGLNPNSTLDSRTVGINPAGRWDYAVNDATLAYLPPMVPLRTDPDYGVVAFPDGSYADGRPGKGPSATPESYMDTPVVNGVAYPTMTVEPKAYRVRFLNGANDRYWNLSLWKADTSVASADGRRNTELKMVPPGALAADGVTLNTSNDPAGVPDPSTAGPSIIQFGNEAGFFPAPVVHKPTLMRFNALGEEIAGDFYLGGAERADTVIDFSQFAGQTLIMYNDSTAPVPGGDPRYDYYTGNADQSLFGGAPSTRAGFGPNTRTVMQIVVASTLKSGAAPAAAYDPANSGGALATELPKAYSAVADTHIVATLPLAPNIDTLANTITVNGKVEPLQIKTIHGFTDPNVGRLIAQLGTELPGSAGNPTPLAYIDAPTDIINAGDTQYWLIKNYDVDNHPMHFHLFNVQVLGHRVHADGSLRPPERDEMGWKETVKNWPGEDLIVALKPKTPLLPFGLPNSVRLLDPTLPAGATASDALYQTANAGGSVPFAFAQLDLNPASATYGQSKPVSNTLQDYGWEYVWHCHILGHEENDLMRPLVFKPVVNGPAAPTGVAVSSTGNVTWTDTTPALDASRAPVAATKGNPANEIGFRVERAALNNNSTAAPVFVALAPSAPMADGRVNTLANATSFQDLPAPFTDYSYRVLAVNEAGSTGPALNSTPVILKQAPAAPSALAAVATAVTNKWSVALNWNDRATNETGYVVQRAVGTINNLSGIPTWGAFSNLPLTTSVLAANLSAYADGSVGVTANTLYKYQVYALNGTLVGPTASVIVATAANLGAAPNQLQATGAPTATTLGVQWQNTASTLATGYEVQQCVGTVAMCKLATASWTPVPGAIVSGATNTKFVATALTTKTNYSFRVRVINTVVPKATNGDPGLVSLWSAPLGLKTL